MQRNSVAIVGAAESTHMGKLPEMAQIQIHADSALNNSWSNTDSYV